MYLSDAEKHEDFETLETKFKDIAAEIRKEIVVELRRDFQQRNLGRLAILRKLLNLVHLSIAEIK